MNLLEMDKDTLLMVCSISGNGLIPTNNSTVVINADKKELYEKGSNKCETVEEMSKRTEPFC